MSEIPTYQCGYFHFETTYRNAQRCGQKALALRKFLYYMVAKVNKKHQTEKNVLPPVKIALMLARQLSRTR